MLVTSFFSFPLCFRNLSAFGLFRSRSQTIRSSPGDTELWMQAILWQKLLSAFTEPAQWRKRTNPYHTPNVITGCSQSSILIHNNSRLFFFSFFRIPVKEADSVNLRLDSTSVQSDLGLHYLLKQLNSNSVPKGLWSYCSESRHNLLYSQMGHLSSGTSSCVKFHCPVPLVSSHTELCSNNM